MKRIFGQAKPKEPPPSLTEASSNLDKRGTVLDDKIKKLDIELHKFREQMSRVRPGPAQTAIKQRALRVLKQKRLYESQRDSLYNQQYTVDQVSFTQETIQDNVSTITAMKHANTAMKKQFKENKKVLDIDNIEKMTDEMSDLMDQANEINEVLSASYGLPDDIDDEELMGELDALELDLATESELSPDMYENNTSETGAKLPSYLAEPDPLPEVPLIPGEQNGARTEQESVPQAQEA